jgi:hypothetical protein
MMRKTWIAAGLAALALAATPGQAQTAQASPAADKDSFAINYAIRVKGINAGDFSFSMRRDGDAYQAQASRKATGLVRSMVGKQQDFVYSSSGRLTAAGPRPQSYQHSGGKNGRIVNVAFSADDAVTTATPKMGMGNPPATRAQRAGVIDQVSMFVALVTASGDPCARTLPVFMDGRMRFDFTMRPAGATKIRSGPWKGEALRCAVRFTPIAGFGDPQEAADLTFLMAPLPNGWYAPVQIEMPTDDAGVITLEAKSLKVG